MDRQILQRAQEEISAEQVKKLQSKEKTIQQKKQRDNMLHEAKSKKEKEYKDARSLELKEVSDLKKALEAEKKQKVEKKFKEREQAQRVIKENELEKEKRVLEKENDRMQQNVAIEEYNKMLDAQEQKRADEWAKREQKIKDAMSRMADTVLKKSNAAEKEMEKRVIQYAN